MKEIRLRLNLSGSKYLLYNKGAWFGYDTVNQDLWLKGYTMRPKKLLGRTWIIAEKLW